MYVYIRSEPQLYTVGFYAPGGSWVSESDWSTKEEAAARVHYLNGGTLQLQGNKDHSITASGEHRNKGAALPNPGYREHGQRVQAMCKD